MSIPVVLAEISFLMENQDRLSFDDDAFHKDTSGDQEKKGSSTGTVKAVKTRKHDGKKRKNLFRVTD